MKKTAWTAILLAIFLSLGVSPVLADNMKADTTAKNAMTPAKTWTVEFGEGSTDMSALAKGRTDEIAAMLKKNPNLKINVIGYASTTGRGEDTALSERRADMVRRDLVERLGIAANRVTTTARGTANASGDLIKDRRVVVELVDDKM